MTYMRGLNQLQKSSFYDEKKTRDLLMEANPHLKNGKGKLI